VVRAGKGGRLADDFEKLGVVTIGFSPVGDVSGKSREEIFQYVKSLEARTPGNVAGMIDRFARVMQEGDVVVTSSSRTALCHQQGADRALGWPLASGHGVT